MGRAYTRAKQSLVRQIAREGLGFTVEGDSYVGMANSITSVRELKLGGWSESISIEIVVPLSDLPRVTAEGYLNKYVQVNSDEFENKRLILKEIQSDEVAVHLGLSIIGKRQPTRTL